MNPSNLLCVIDTETTGLTDDPNAAVIEVAATVWDVSAGQEIRCWSTLVKPASWGEEGRRIAQEVCGLDSAWVDLHGEDPALALMRLLDFAKNLPLHAWNRPFDEEMICRMDPKERRLAREGLWGPCLMREFSAVSRGNPDLRSKLTLAYQQCGFTVSSAHRALADARMAAQSICHLRNGGTLLANVPKGPSSYAPSPAPGSGGKRRWSAGGIKPVEAN